jgi:hypothetical protein
MGPHWGTYLQHRCIALYVEGYLGLTLLRGPDFDEKLLNKAAAEVGCDASLMRLFPTQPPGQESPRVCLVGVEDRSCDGSPGRPHCGAVNGQSIDHPTSPFIIHIRSIRIQSDLYVIIDS